MIASLLTSILGNELAKRYDMPKHHAASGGHECLWKIYQATAKATGEPVSVFVLEIEDFKASMAKNEREQLLEIFRRDIRALKEMNHPNVLRVIEVMEESKKCLAFVAERVLLSLANALHRFRNLPAPGQQLPFEVVDFRATEPEVGRGLCHLAEALQYTHYVGRRLHMGLCPEAVFITPAGVWKLGGFGFSVTLAPNEVGPNMQVLCPYYQSNVLRKAGGFRLEPHLSYTAPEVTTLGTSRVTYAIDAFSLGCLVYDAFQMVHLVGPADVAKPLLDLPEYATAADQLRRIEQSYPWDLGRLPAPDLRDLTERLLAGTPAHRPECASLASVSYFHTGAVATLRELDALPAKDPASQATIVSKLSERLSQFTPRMLKQAILPPVLAAAQTSPSLWVYAIPLVIKVAESLSRDDFIATVQGGLLKALTLRPPNPQVMYLLGQHLPFLLDNTERAFFTQHVYPTLLLSLESNVPQLQDQALKHISTEKLYQAVGNQAMLEEVLPRIGKIIVTTAHVSVRVNALVCLTKTQRCYGRKVLIDAILPTLKVCLDKDRDPAVVMAVVAAYDCVLKEIGDPEYVCTHALPVLVPLLYLRTLNSAQFDKVATRVQSMLARAVETRRAEVGTASAASTTTATTAAALTATSSSSSSSAAAGAARAPSPYVDVMSLPTSTSSAPTVASAFSQIGDLAGYRPPASGSAASSSTSADATMAAANGTGPGNGDGSASSLSDWSWLAQSLPAASLSLEGLEPPGASGGGGSSSSRTTNLNSGGSIKYDSYGSNPYEMPGTEFAMPTTTAAGSSSSASSVTAPPAKPPHRKGSASSSSLDGSLSASARSAAATAASTRPRLERVAAPSTCGRAGSSSSSSSPSSSMFDGLKTSPKSHAVSTGGSGLDALGMTGAASTTGMGLGLSAPITPLKPPPKPAASAASSSPFMMTTPPPSSVAASTLGGMQAPSQPHAAQAYMQPMQPIPVQQQQQQQQARPLAMMGGPGGGGMGMGMYQQPQPPVMMGMMPQQPQQQMQQLGAIYPRPVQQQQQQQQQQPGMGMGSATYDPMAVFDGLGGATSQQQQQPPQGGGGW